MLYFVFSVQIYMSSAECEITNTVQVVINLKSQRCKIIIRFATFFFTIY